MARGGRGIVAVIVGAVIVAAALAVVYLLIISPRSQQAKMQEEVEALASRWAEVRACFYGEKPRSSDPTEALILRELTAPGLETELAVCEEALRRTRREEGPSSGVAAVEDAWDQLRDARRALAQALAIRLQVPRPRPIEVLRAGLAKAAIGAEAAYAALREAAELEPDPLEGAAVKAARPEPIAVAGAPAAQLWVENNAILAARTAEGGGRALQLLDGQGAGPITAGPGEEVGFGGRWVAKLESEAERTALVVRELDPPAGDKAADPRRVEVATPGSGAVISGALDNGKGRRLLGLYDPATRDLALYRSDDSGASWRRQVLESNLESWPTRDLFPIQRRLVLGIGQQRRYEIGGLELAVSTRPVYSMACFADSVSWWLTERGLSTARPGEELAPVTGSEEMPWLVNSCTDNQALGIGPVDPEIELPSQKLRLCSRDGCQLSATLPRARGARVAAVIAPLAGPLVAFEIDGVVLLWAGAEGGSGLEPRTWMRLPEGDRLAGLVEWAGKARAVVRSDSGFALASFE